LSTSDTVRLRYTGKHAQVFTAHGIGEVEEGAEFDVPGDHAERYTRRPDVELASPSGKPGGSKRGTVPSTQDERG
jgi:hypothetical protein